nr:hypothetical protein [Tanacetum cinerariifolium]
MVINSPCCSNEELASPKANGSCNEALAIPGKTATGKEKSSPFEFSLVYLVVTSVQIFNVVSSKLLLFGLMIDAAHLLLLDRKKVIIIEDSIRQALRLDDADSSDCLPNEEIFVELAGMGYEKPSTNLTVYKAFSQPNGSRKFNFSKYIFDCLVRNMDSPSKFLMYLRFLQLIINAQVGDLSSHTTKYTSLTLTQKVFVNMKRVRKGFFGVDTPLFDGMLVPQQAHDVEDATKDENDFNEVSAEPTPPLPTPATSPPPPQQEHIPSPPQAETA